MNIRFENSEFVIVGILASTVPILIHLWYRRRFRVVHWAAMEFLLAAVQRKKKGLRVRDILLLTLRILVVVLLGLFFSKPWIEGSAPALPMRMALILVVGVIGLGFCVAWTLMNPPRRWMIAVGVSIEAFMGLSLLLTIMNSPVVDRTDGVSPNTPVHALLVVDNSRSMGVNYAGKTFLDRAK